MLNREDILLAFPEALDIQRMEYTVAFKWLGCKLHAYHQVDGTAVINKWIGGSVVYGYGKTLVKAKEDFLPKLIKTAREELGDIVELLLHGENTFKQETQHICEQETEQ